MAGVTWPTEQTSKSSRRIRARRRAVLAVVVGSLVGACLVTFALVVPWLVGPVRIVDTSGFTDLESGSVVTVWGDVHVRITGTWTASSPIWQWWGYSGVYSTPMCYPRCGAPSVAGVLNYTADICTNAPGGGTNYRDGPTLTIYLVFATQPGAADTVSLDLTAVVSPATACA